jgi:hypothetical protein
MYHNSSPLKMVIKSTITNKWYILSIIIILFSLLTAEIFLGHKVEQQAIDRIKGSKNIDWAEKRFKDEHNSLPIPKKHTRYRILYLSNSHAFTGGYVPKHLQELLNKIFPDEYEVINLSHPGMFAPEFLQRFAAALNYKIDLVILPVAYISFSDRMGLTNQARTARSYFKPDIFPYLSLNFWKRNYDINLFLNDLVGHFSALYLYRNDIRKLWENPLSSFFKQTLGIPKTFFLEADENQSWRFPDGFDHNLFDWRLYSLGRANHLADIRELLQLAETNHVPVIACNLPIDFAKDPHIVNLDDFSRYREELRTLFHHVTNYTDYQNTFPADFSTYDALHPQWHGARLHAFDFILKINQLRKQKLPEPQILSIFIQSDKPVSKEYRQCLEQPLTRSIPSSMRRYDIFEPNNAHELLERLNATKVGTWKEHRILQQLSRRIRYWGENVFFQESLYTNYSPVMAAAVKNEIYNAKIRLAFFKEKLIQLQQQRLRLFPYIFDKKDTLVKKNIIHVRNNVKIQTETYKFNGLVLQLHKEMNSAKIFAYTVENKNKKILYTRIDILGDGSFIQCSFNGTIKLPDWLTYKKPFSMFGT